MARCAVCRFEVTEGTLVRCRRCEVPAHHDCWAITGDCPVFGCREEPRAQLPATPPICLLDATATRPDVPARHETAGRHLGPVAGWTILGGVWCYLLCASWQQVPIDLVLFWLVARSPRHACCR